MHYILDTDICSYIIRESSPILLKNLNDHYQDKISITSVTYAELLFGAEKRNSKKIREKIEAIASKVNIISFDQNAAIEYSTMRKKLEQSGTPVGNMDMLIASCVLSEDAVLVTNNEKHFSNINGLKIENWTQ
jgi:tRNA(fMet)-specific endonuclease VapC